MIIFGQIDHRLRLDAALDVNWFVVPKISGATSPLFSLVIAALAVAGDFFLAK